MKVMLLVIKYEICTQKPNKNNHQIQSNTINQTHNQKQSSKHNQKQLSKTSNITINHNHQ